MPRSIITFVLALLTLLPAVASAQNEGPQPPLRDPYLLTGSRLRNAFRPVVETARTWTVEILDEKGRRVAQGVIVSSDGEILTKASELPEQFRVRLSNRRTFAGEVLKKEDVNDLALVKIDQTDLPVVTWQETELTDGQWLITPGISVTPVAVGVLGVQPRKVPQSVRGVLGIQMDVGGPPRIIEVFSEGGAHAAGVLVDDVILKIDGKEMAHARNVVETVQKYRPGEKIVLSLERKGEPIEIEATLTHPFGQLLSRIAMQNQLGGELSDRRDDFPLVFQHDSVLQPRDCGGIVVDLDGQAVGLNIARAGRTETYSLPVSVVQEMLKSLRETSTPATETSTSTTSDELNK
ncbi:MAG: PDZ domain-containing protein [Planctomycetaceae bacterium]|nr:PDZ domain-containing protein [Planctomycetaceae bacterium]